MMIKSSESMLTSGQAVWHRSLLMASPDASALTAVERNEFSRMCTEKI
jgi:hypothetical protein